MASGSSSPDVRIARLAARQHSLITRDQALDRGLTRSGIAHRIASRRWERIHPGVYRIAGSAESWAQSVLAACLAAGDVATASHVTAGVLWGLIERERPPIHVTVPFVRHPSSRGFTVHRSRLGVGNARKIDGVPVTCPARTLLDLAGALAAEELEEAVHAALRRRLVRPNELATELTQVVGSGRRGVRILARLVAERSAGTVPDGVFETRFLRMLRRAGLPLPELQFEVRRGGILVGRVDLAYPRERIAIELDGYRDHSSRRAFERDRLRQNELHRAGYTVLRFTWPDLRRHAYVRDVVKRMLWERGHPGVVSV